MMPILASFGSFHIFSYGFSIALGVLTALFLMRQQARRDGFPAPDQIYDIVFFVMVTGFLGARIFYVVQHARWYFDHPLEIAAFWQGGLVFYGGMIVSFISLGIYCRQKKISFLKILDFIVPYIALIHAFGRIGCFLNGCCYGNACSMPWAVKFPGMDAAVHPVQLYEAIYNLGLFFLLRFLYAGIENRHKKPMRVWAYWNRGQTHETNTCLSPIPQKKWAGEIAVIYFFFYAAGRFGLEFFRTQENPGWFFTWNQWISLGVMLAAAVLLRYRFQKCQVQQQLSSKINVKEPGPFGNGT